MAYNSTIISRKKNLKCGHFDFAFSKGRCQQCAKVEDFYKKQEKQIEGEGLSELIKQADELFSKYIRQKYADKNGMVKCFTCDNELRWQDSQCGHYISRNCLFLRWDERNAKPQDEHCNCYKHGNLAVYGKRLEEQNPGLTEILYNESKLVYHFSREELRNIISELKQKINKL